MVSHRAEARPLPGHPPSSVSMAIGHFEPVSRRIRVGHATKDSILPRRGFRHRRQMREVGNAIVHDIQADKV